MHPVVAGGRNSCLDEVNVEKDLWGFTAFQSGLFAFFCAHILPFRFLEYLGGGCAFAMIGAVIAMFVTDGRGESKGWPLHLLSGSFGFMMGLVFATQGPCMRDEYNEWLLYKDLYSVRSQTQGAGHVSTEPLGGAVVSLDHGHRLVARAVHDV